MSDERGRRSFADAALAFAPYMERSGIDVAAFWEDTRAALSDPALLQRDREVMARWNEALGLDYGAEASAIRRSGRAALDVLLRPAPRTLP